MRSKRFLSALLAVLCSLSLCGCQLAKENQGEGSATAHIIGVFITTEYLDLFDAEAYLQDHSVGMPGGEVAVSGNTAQYEGRYYATLDAKPSSNPYSRAILYQYLFHGIEGFPFYSAHHPDTVDMQYFLASVYDSAITDFHTNIFVTDAGEQDEIEGTIYLSTTQATKRLYMNPVYQADDGSVYVQSGEFVEHDGEVTEGPYVTYTYSDTATATRNGVSQVNGNSTKISVAFLNPPTKIVVIQLDQYNEVVTSAEYQPGKVPETLAPEVKTEYIVVEARKTDPAGASSVTRELYTRENIGFFTFYAREDGICVKQYTELTWQQASQTQP